MNKDVKVGLVSLGCDKNRVDSEKLLAEISKEYAVTADVNEADVLVINTCAFLDSSRAEAIQTVFEYVPYKEDGKLQKIILTGCMPQKFVGDLFDELTEVDGFLGTYDGSKINEAISRVLGGERVNFVGKGKELGCERVVTTPQHYAYLKISDGCSNHCTYCLIPKIRGAFKSTPIEDLVKEASMLLAEELILVAQDVTRYGVDLYGKSRLVDLIRELSKLENVKRIRLLYCYPELIDDALIDELATNDKLVKYLDVPFQHASDRILKLMNRKGTYKSYLSLIKTLKKRVKGIAVRSTFIAGFPTETEEDFEILKKFIFEAKLTNAGFFAYSKEADTPAYKLKGHLPAAVKKRRVKALYAAQAEVVKGFLGGLVGRRLEVVCDGVDYKADAFYGRAYFNSPDVDGKVYLYSDGVIEQGETYVVKVTKVKGYDLVAKVVEKL